MNKTPGIVIIALMASALIAGCGVQNSSGAGASTPSASASLYPPAPPINPGSGASPSSTPSSASTSPSHTSAAPDTSSPPQASGSPSQSSTEAAVSLIRAWMQSGASGQGPGMPIGDGQNISAVEQQWGSGTSTSGSGAGVYITYPTHSIAFGVNQGNQIVDVRSFQSALHQITRSTLFSVLGQPPATRYADNTTIYVYPDGADYQVLWVFSGGPGQTGNTVDHVDVTWPQGTVNLMAQTVSNPSITVTTAPGSQGSYFTFSIDNPPAGYQLAELEWIPASGTSDTAVNTLPQAIYNANHGTTGELFMAVNGAYRFQYTSAMSGQTGSVRLIYQNTAGNTVIGTSSSITLN